MEEKAVVEYQSRDGQLIKLSPSIIKKYLVSGNPDYVTNQELYLYMGICKSRGLNPFIRDCYLIKYSQGDNAAIVVSIDYYRKRARAQRDCRGWKVGIILINKKGEIERREGCLLLQGEELAGAWFEAKPEGWDVPMRKEINLAPYIKRTRDGKVTAFWKEEKQPEQIAKVVESQGLRATWPDEFQGLYVDAERESMEAQQELDNAIGKEEAEDKEGAGDKLKEKFGEPGKKSTEAPEPPPESEPLPPEPPPEDEPKHEPPTKGEDFGVWNRENWINLRKPGFSTYVYKNLKSLIDMPQDLIAEVIDKWHGMYEEPFPELKPREKEAQAAEPGLEPEQAEDPEAEERLRTISKIKDFDETLIFQAKTVLGLPTRESVWPPSLDGCNMLYEKCQELNEGE